LTFAVHGQKWVAWIWILTTHNDYDSWIRLTSPTKESPSLLTANESNHDVQK
jgi:hypothetical protein